MKDGVEPADDRAQIGKLEREVTALVEAISTGALRDSPALAQRLKEAEAALSRVKVRPVSTPNVEHLLPQLIECCWSVLKNLDRTFAQDPRRARMELTEHEGPIRVRTTPDEIVLEAQKGYMEAALLRATGTDGTRQISVVAGAGFDAYLEVRLG
jgi:hypothetical protein